MARKKRPTDKAREIERRAEGKVSRAMLEDENRHKRFRIYDEYDWLRSFGKSHEAACRQLGTTMAAFERMVLRSQEIGERLPKMFNGRA
ncbi:helix-turn-helix DNA binding domain protein [Gordonia phage Soos]|nr:helix-turn-helix DNA binding domain protein [Gordonia phage Soos]